MVKISCVIRALRKEKKLTQEDLAEKLGVSRQSIISVETGKSMPSLSLALEIANLFHKAIEDIFLIDCDEDNNYSPYLLLDDGRENMNKDLMPWRSMGFGRFFNEDWPETSLSNQTIANVPAINVYEDENNVIVDIQIPEIDPEHLKIDFAENILKIKIPKTKK